MYGGYFDLCKTLRTALHHVNICFLFPAVFPMDTLAHGSNNYITYLRLPLRFGCDFLPLIRKSSDLIERESYSVYPPELVTAFVGFRAGRACFSCHSITSISVYSIIALSVRNAGRLPYKL